MHEFGPSITEEVTSSVIDGPNSYIYEQAENRLHAQKAVLISLMA